MSWQPINELVRQVKQQDATAKSFVEKALALIEAQAEHQAIIATTRNRALDRAAMIDELIRNGKNPGRLAGIPFIAKDNYLAFGADTTAASNMLRGFDAPYQATVIERLESEGAILVAKANLDAFAHGSSTENSDFFTTTNPVDSSRVPGGSSGGSAVAVVLGMAPFALGSDTGGSIRLPASFSGCVGLKPTYGLVSRSGVIAMASSFDCMGPLTTRVDDAALVLDVIAGNDPLDATTIARDETPYTALDNGELKGKLVGVISEYMNEGVDPEIIAITNDAVNKLKAAGAIIKEISLPSLNAALAAYYILCPAEVSSNLSRYDGLRFGHSAQTSGDLSASYEQARQEGFGLEAKRRIMIGTYVLSSGYYDAYYKRALIVRTKIINDFKAAFDEVDILMGPTAASTAFKIGEHTKDPMKMYLTDIMTVAANLAGIPAISLPAGAANGLPVGIQFMAPQRADRALLSFAASFEGITE
jgi:aspartyl-tRNA(Asn)/glutamyl-tRNA(Gln) amidotransferase subunit A